MQSLLGGQPRAPYEIRDSEELLIQEKENTLRIYTASIVNLLREQWAKVKPGQFLILTLPPDLMNLMVDCLKSRTYIKHGLYKKAVIDQIENNFNAESVGIFYEIKKERHSLLSRVGLKKPSTLTEKGSLTDLENLPKEWQYQNPTFYCRMKKPLN